MYIRMFSAALNYNNQELEKACPRTNKLITICFYRYHMMLLSFYNKYFITLCYNVVEGGGCLVI